MSHLVMSDRYHLLCAFWLVAFVLVVLILNRIVVHCFATVVFDSAFGQLVFKVQQLFDIPPVLLIVGHQHLGHSSAVPQVQSDLVLVVGCFWWPARLTG